MNKTQIFAILGILFLSYIILGNSILSQISAQGNQTGTEENEAEKNTGNNEPGNTCATDSTCKNKNEINNG